MDNELIDALHNNRFEIAIETNGTLLAPKNIDWICVSPKSDTKLKQVNGNELKLVFPQKGMDPLDFEQFDFEHFSLQPLDGPNIKNNTELTLNYCKEHPRWNLSLQTHKFLGIP
jgi:organic radical activating enzyme